MNIEDVRCIIEGVILPVVAWLAKLFGAKKNAAAGDAQNGVDAPAGTANVIPERRNDMDPKIRALQENGDLYGLLSVLHAGPDPVLRLDAADALARMGNEEGVDYLIGRLAADDALERDAAREILQQLNDPRGNAALQDPPIVVAEAAMAPSALSALPHSAASPAPHALSAGTGVAGGAWAAYFDKQASLDAVQPAGSPQPATADPGPLAAIGPAPAGQVKRPRWIRDLLPGALGALLITLASAAFLYFTTPANASEQEKGLLLSQVMCAPVSLAMGALFGSAGGLFTKRIMVALHASEPSQATTATIGSFISGAITGFLCDFLFMMAAAL